MAMGQWEPEYALGLDQVASQCAHYVRLAKKVRRLKIDCMPVADLDSTLADTHRVFIKGPTTLQPNEIVCPPGIRPATIIVIGMLAAKGRSVLRNTYSINRGYEDLSKRLRKLGADIREVK